MQFTLSEIPDINSSRIIGVEVKRIHHRSLYIFGVYLPSDSNIQPCSTELNHLDALFNHFCTIGDVIIGGDLNTSIYESDSAHVNLYKSKALREFMLRNDLCCPILDFPVTGSSYTFSQTKTSLDFILCNKSLCTNIHRCHILEEGTFNSTSDHL